MIKIVGVRFRTAGKIYYFDPKKLPIKKGDHVIVETARGIEYGSVVANPKEIPDDEVVQPLKAVMRIATPDDDARVERNLAKEKDAMRICAEKIRKHKLDMKLIDAEYTFDNNKKIRPRPDSHRLAWEQHPHDHRCLHLGRCLRLDPDTPQRIFLDRSRPDQINPVPRRKPDSYFNQSPAARLNPADSRQHEGQHRSLPRRRHHRRVSLRPGRPWLPHHLRQPGLQAGSRDHVHRDPLYSVRNPVSGGGSAGEEV